MVCTTPDTRPRHSGMWHSAQCTAWAGIGGGLQVLYTFTLYTIAVQILYTVQYCGIYCVMQAHYNCLSSLKVKYIGHRSKIEQFQIDILIQNIDKIGTV